MIAGNAIRMVVTSSSISGYREMQRSTRSGASSSTASWKELFW